MLLHLLSHTPVEPSLINELAATEDEDTTYVTDSVDGRDNLFHRAGKSAIAIR